MSNILDKLKKNCRIKEADILADSQFFNNDNPVSTEVPMINVALSGALNGGLLSGTTLLCGESKHFKCLGPNTPITIYKKEYEKIQTTYKQLHELLGQDPNIEYFVKSHTGNYTKILAICQKKSNTYSIDFDNGVSFVAGDKHSFMNMIDQSVCTDELIPGERIKTLTGSTKVVARYDFKEDQDVYDIMVGDPHWYTNDEQHGIIHHNTSFALLIASAYLKKYPDAALIFYDTEFGSPQSYFSSFGIDLNKVLHVPIKNIEELKFELVNQLEQIDKKEKVIIIVDSFGNIASKKELDDALNEKSVADMSRAKALKGLFRMITPYLATKDIPLLGICHIYQDMGLFPKSIVSGGKGLYYAADNIWMIGRQQDKVGTEIQGYHFIINIEKSRFLKEKSKIPISVSWEGGIEKWSGLLEVAKELGYVKNEKQGWWCAFDPATQTALTGNLRAAATMTKEFWQDTIFAKTDFADAVKKHYTISLKYMLPSDKEPIEDADSDD